MNLKINRPNEKICKFAKHYATNKEGQILYQCTKKDDCNEQFPYGERRLEKHLHLCRKEIQKAVLENQLKGKQ